MPFDGHIRVSRVGDRSGESYISPATQEKAIHDRAQRRGERVELNPPEENVSGGTMDRPILNTIMERIRGGESKGIVVYQLDRFARYFCELNKKNWETAARSAVERGGRSRTGRDCTAPRTGGEPTEGGSVTGGR